MRPAADGPSLRVRLVEQLCRDDDVTMEIDSVATVRIDEYRGLVAAPLRWQLTDEQLDAYVAALDADDLEALWPGRPPEWKAFALLSVHLEEVLATSEGPVSIVRLVDGQLSVE